MDISFHYFAVKSVALAAGLSESKAQRLAEFSQFIDDYNWYVYFEAENIPSYIRDPQLDIVLSNNLINPVTTGFSTISDMATLILDRSQKFTVSPFHFIPQNPHSVSCHDRRTVPATLNDDSYISNMLNTLKSDILETRIDENDALMKIGMLFHTFADTYAHQLFTGYSDKTNSVKIVSVFNNVTQCDETEHYRYWVEKWISSIEEVIQTKLPLIGHMAIGHVPDLSHLSFEMEYTSMDGTLCNHMRSNTATFITACRELYTYLRQTYPNLSANMSWDNLAEKLIYGFTFDASKELEENESAAVRKLSEHWSNTFSENHYSYSYNSEQIKTRFMRSCANTVKTITVDGTEYQVLSGSYSDDFYKFNLFGNLLLINLYGEHPRRWVSLIEE